MPLPTIKSESNFEPKIIAKNSLGNITEIQPDIFTMAFTTDKLLTDQDVKNTKELMHDFVNADKADTANRTLIIDLNNIKHISALILGNFVNMKRTLRTRKDEAIIAGVNPDMTETLRITRLDQIFKLYGTAEAAIQATVNASVVRG